jgi:hypothetical protein
LTTKVHTFQISVSGILFWSHARQISPQLPTPHEKLGKSAVVHVFFKLRYAHHCLLVRGLNKSRYIKHHKNPKRKIKHTVHIFTETQHCWQHYATQLIPAVSQSFQFQLLLFKYKTHCWQATLKFLPII